MNNQNYTVSFSVSQTPEEVFNAVNNVRGWWSEEVEGNTSKLGEEFNYHFKEFHRCTLKITEFVPNEKVVWLVTDNYFSFTKNTTEWTGTEITFEIKRDSDTTKLQFTHVGLVPEYECYNACVDGWNTYINGSLRNLITTGKGTPNVGEAVTDSEQAVSK